MTNYEPGNYDSAGPRNQQGSVAPHVALVRALFGPLMLTVMGAMFVVDYSGGPTIGQTWPVLIIVAGLLKLGEFLGARRA